MPQKKTKRTTSKKPENGERLQKVLAAAGYGSRRDCEELIVEGRVEIDREIITELGVRVKPEQKIRVDGVPVKVARKQYFLVNKPPGIVSTNRDPDGRARVIDLVNSDQRLFTVGRLDKSSEGLILVTNDGEFANQLTHPRHGVSKTYIVKVTGVPSFEDLKKLTDGVHLAEGFAKAASAKLKKKFRQGAELEIVLSEGRNREIRRLLARIGHKVLKLKRVALGPLRLGALPAGECRRLKNEEIAALRAAVKPGTSGGRKASKRKRVVKKRPASTRDYRTSKKKKQSGNRAERMKPGTAPRIGAIIGEDLPSAEERPKKKSKAKRKTAKKRAGSKANVAKKDRRSTRGKKR